MFKTQLVPMAFSALLSASPLAIAEEAHHPGQTAEGEAPTPMAVEAPAETSDDAEPGMGPAAAEGSGMAQPGTPGQGGGMMMPGMMNQPMMGGMQGTGGSPGGMMKGGPGMMGQRMMGGMQGMGGGPGGGMMKGGHGMMQKHRDVVNRLDLIDARLIKIEALLERLMQR